MRTFLFIFLAGYAVRCDDSKHWLSQNYDETQKNCLTPDFNVRVVASHADHQVLPPSVLGFVDFYNTRFPSVRILQSLNSLSSWVVTSLAIPLHSLIPPSFPPLLDMLKPSYYVVQMPENDVVPKKEEFRVYWNVPTMQCKSKKIYFGNLYEKYGIIQNANDSFRGDKISILYDPGDFPALLRNSSSGEIKYRNGGVPQEGDLEEHLSVFRNVMEQSVPDKDFNGIGIIDFESWKPILRQNFGILTPYKDVSYEIEKKRHWWWQEPWIKAEAKRRFEGAGRDFMEATISLAKEMRPKAVWGYYGYPYCFNMAYNNRKETCADKVPQENDRINWLWKESTALYPSVYSTDDMTPGQLAGLIRGRVKEAARVSVRGTPILPYFWYRYREKEFFSESDLDIAISIFYKSNASGFIIWGSSNDVNTVEKCTYLKKYVDKILGPTVAKYTKRKTTLHDEPDETENVIFKPSNASQYDPQYVWIPPVNYTQHIEEMVDKELKEEKEAANNKKIEESLLIDMILHKIANYCAEGCDSKINANRTEDKVGADGTSESRIILVTENPFRKNSSGIEVTVPTTTENDIIYDYDVNPDGATTNDLYETNEYSNLSTTIINIQETSTIVVSREEESTTVENNEDTVNFSTTESSENDLRTDQADYIDLLAEEIIAIDIENAINSTFDLSTVESTVNDLSTTDSTTSQNMEETSISDNDVENSTIRLERNELEINIGTEEYGTIDSIIVKESTTAGTNSTKSESGTTLAPVFTEQVVVSVV